MEYKDIVAGEFIKRPNRFIAHVRINNQEEIVHVKNTGRCTELLKPGAKVFLEPSANPNRKTKYSLISVYKKDRLINMDSQVPNQVIFEALKENKIKEIKDSQLIKREVTYGHSRFDIYYENKGEKGFMEVKGVTLEKNGVAMFPDAPTTRGTKHINELIRAKKEGYQAYIMFLVQMDGIHTFVPNFQMDEAFSRALKNAKEMGVEVIGYNSIVTKEGIGINQGINVNLE
nr:DNA/RNA nuclease SfsA [Natranaerovirga hydrolytica]